jgi:hypothetical protein
MLSERRLSGDGHETQNERRAVCREQNPFRPFGGKNQAMQETESNRERRADR